LPNPTSNSARAKIRQARHFRPSLHVEITGRLRDMIMRHELEPGAWVPEGELCDRLGVSRTPLREALKALAAERLVTLYPFRGVAVAELSTDHVGHLFELQSMLESSAASLAAERATGTEIADFEKVHKRMVRFYERGDRKAYFALNEDLHKALVAMSHNPALVEAHATKLLQVQRARFVALDIGRRWAESVQQHSDILDALKSRDAKRLARLVRKHVEATGTTVRTAVENYLEGKPASSDKLGGVRRRVSVKV
jgi:DNA-binding GntR family transcriptional regulator